MDMYAGDKEKNGPEATVRALHKVHESRSWSPTRHVRNEFRQTGGPAGANTYPAHGLPIHRKTLAIREVPDRRGLTS